MNLLIDGNNQAFVSNMVGNLSTKDGFPTSAISGFIKAVRSYLTIFPRTEKIIIVFDGGKSKKRMALMPDYKGDRESKRNPGQQIKFEEFKQQIPVIKGLMKLLGADIVDGPGIEADDIIALIVYGTEFQNVHTVIVSSDKDFYQLVSPLTSIYKTTSAAKDRHITIENFEEVKGMRPDQWLDFHAMMGDKSDCVPGCKGVGEKTARGIIQKFGSYQDFLDEIPLGYTPTKLEQRAADNVENFKISKRMMDLKSTEMIEDPNEIRINKGRPALHTVLEILRRLEMEEFLESIDTWIKLFPGFKTIGEAA